ncbi:hypothetical protein SAMN04487962_101135 [Marinobacter segnicrescens]|uniref:Uncharacterized protein n=1 Tax=Marinobacter segnicrescens TaxID=430453 RepID=A0A1H9YF92_9GAMM|nr:hypothetical protein SAMN04487962_101135 [Marinobacter segnicrescens]
MKDYVFYISLAALLLGLFNLYWSAFRHSRKLFLIRLDSYYPNLRPEFTIVNGGNKDILITSLNGILQNNEGNPRSNIAKKIDAIGTSTPVISSESSVHYRVEFDTPIHENILKNGDEDPQYKELKLLDFVIQIEWIEVSGERRRTSVKLFKYGFDAAGEIKMRKPLEEKTNLYSRLIKTPWNSANR